MKNESTQEKNELLELSIRSMNDEELLAAYKQMKDNPGIAGDFIGKVALIKDELIQRKILHMLKD